MPSHTVALTRQDLDTGRPGRCRACPLWLAGHRVLGDRLLGVRWNGSFVVASHHDRFGETARTSPQHAQALKWAVAAIDQGMADLVEPFEVQLEVSDYADPA